MSPSQSPILACGPSSSRSGQGNSAILYQIVRRTRSAADLRRQATPAGAPRIAKWSMCRLRQARSGKPICDVNSRLPRRSAFVAFPDFGQVPPPSRCSHPTNSSTCWPAHMPTSLHVGYTVCDQDRLARGEFRAHLTHVVRRLGMLSTLAECVNNIDEAITRYRT